VIGQIDNFKDDPILWCQYVVLLGKIECVCHYHGSNATEKNIVPLCADMENFPTQLHKHEMRMEQFLVVPEKGLSKSSPEASMILRQCRWVRSTG
jgi:hypothetical protein